MISRSKFCVESWMEWLLFGFQFSSTCHPFIILLAKLLKDTQWSFRGVIVKMSAHPPDSWSSVCSWKRPPPMMGAKSSLSAIRALRNRPRALPSAINVTLNHNITWKQVLGQHDGRLFLNSGPRNRVNSRLTLTFLPCKNPYWWK